MNEPAKADTDAEVESGVESTNGFETGEPVINSVSSRSSRAIRTLLISCSSLIICLALIPIGFTQVPARSRIEQLRARSLETETRALAEPFVGITTGQVMSRLFAIRPIGVSTEPISRAADEFLSSLTEEQRTRTTFGIDDPEWRKWMPESYYVRQGVSFKEMNEGQREKAFELLRVSLSARGFSSVRNVMRLNHTLGELNSNNFNEFDELLYYLTMMGNPSTTAPWGWQLDGHHATINCFVVGNQVVMTPFFAGSEPVVATSGKYKGTTVLQDERAKGLAMLNALSPEQRRKAILQSSKTGNNNLAEAFKDNLVIDYAGIYGAELSAQQQQQLLELIGLYMSSIPDGHAEAKMYEVRRHLDTTWFAWIGGTDAKSVFYYRIHSPVVLIEFDHQLPENLRGGNASRLMPTHQHIHVVVRTPNGNDYGKDLLRRHHQQHKHH